jgi:hypothetical protein
MVLGAASFKLTVLRIAPRRQARLVNKEKGGEESAKTTEALNVRRPMGEYSFVARFVGARILLWIGSLWKLGHSETQSSNDWDVDDLWISPKKRNGMSNSHPF